MSKFFAALFIMLERPT